MLEAYVGARPFNARRLLGQVRAVGLRTADESVQMVRDDRDPGADARSRAGHHLCLAGMLDADLVTRDQALAAAPDAFA